MYGYVKGNHLRLLYNGVEYFPALLDAVRAARHEILIETYIYEFDEVGEAVAQALIAAVQRGVEVKLHLDGFGSGDFSPDWQEKLLAAGVQLLFFRPEAGRFFFDRTRLRRLHRKLVVVDGEVGFVGGINIISDFNQDIPNLPPRYDYAVEVRGPLVLRMHATVNRLWRHTAWARFKHEWLRMSRLRPQEKASGQSEARFVIRDNLRHRRDIERAYIDAIRGARREIVLANAYFLPGRRFRHALADAARRGVAVTVLLQGRTDYRLLHHATQALYGALLGCGVRIVEYHPSLLHAKVAVIDGQWSTVGSSNIDPFSLLLAREANVMVGDEHFAATLAASLAHAIADGGREVRQDEWRQAAWPVRFGRWLAYGLVRLIMGVAGYGGSDYRG